MSGPGEYVADSTEGITRVEDLPKPKIVRRSRNYARRPCPWCERSCYRHTTMRRTLHDVGDAVSERPRDLHVTYSQHYCSKCRRYFNVDMSDVAPPKSHYTYRVIALAVRLVVEDGLPYRAASWHLWRDHRVFVPYATIQNWVEAGGKKAQEHIAGEYLDAVLADFSGYIAADELYDGPFCVLSIVDNRTFRRIIYEVLDHDPSHTDMERFFRRFQSLLEERGLELKGITTDGSNLYPEPISRVFGEMPHQICEFHVIKELTKAVLRAVAKVRKELAATKPKLGRGRPSSPEAHKAARRRKRIDQKVAELFEHRYLFVRHELTPAPRRKLHGITRGQRELRTLREIMDQVYRLFDRRCRTETALDKLAKLRRRVRRFKQVGKTLQKLFSPNLEKALTFLDDKLLPSTSNAVERGYRRHRKMQKTVYRVRIHSNITGRIALDMQREERSKQQEQTTHTLHASRSRKAA